jgi:hypothetical protein
VNRHLKITILVEEVGTQGAQPVVESRALHVVDERSLLAARYPQDWLMAELQVPLQRAACTLAPIVFKHILPETAP